MFGASTSLFTAAIVTVPVLAVAPAAIVSFRFVVSVKSPSTAGLTAAADTVTSTATLDAPLRRAVTVLSPPFSPIDVGFSVRLTVGAPSSSAIVSVWSARARTPVLPLAAPDTVTSLFGASTSLSFAAIVTVPVLVVVPAAIVSFRFVVSVKSPSTAGLTGAADTVTVTASLTASLSVAVTRLSPPFSAIVAGVSTNSGLSVTRPRSVSPLSLCV